MDEVSITQHEHTSQMHQYMHPFTITVIMSHYALHITHQSQADMSELEVRLSSLRQICRDPFLHMERVAVRKHSTNCPLIQSNRTSHRSISRAFCVCASI